MEAQVNNAIMIAGIVIILIFVGFISTEVGLTSTTIEAPTGIESPSGGGIWGAITDALAPLSWAVNAVGSLFQLFTFQAQGLPVLANAIIVTPMAFAVFYIVIKLIRGGG